MKIKQAISSKSNEAANKALLKDVASRFSNEVIFKEKVERAKAYLKRAKFPPKSLQ